MKNSMEFKEFEQLDIVLWERIITGDMMALGSLYDLYIDVLFSFGLQRSSDRNYVMDCIHDLFLDLYKYRTKLSTPDNVKNYLIKSLQRKINKKYSEKEVPVGVDYPVMDHLLRKNATLSHEQQMIHIEDVNIKNRQLAKALGALTEKQRKGLVLRFNHNKPYEEIAQIMDVSIQSARTMVYRALKDLRRYPFIAYFLFI